MVGIIAYGAYIPLYRLGKETSGYNGTSERAVASFDEDSVTMAVAAVKDCLNGIDPSTIDALYFASTTSPYSEKQTAALIAESVSLPRNIITVDYSNSVRAGTAALMSAFDAVKAGSARNVIVVAADRRFAPPSSTLETTLGDGAAAFIVGNADNVSLTLEHKHSMSDEILAFWRAEGEEFVSTWEDRFIFDEGYNRVFKQAVSDMLAKSNSSPEDFSKAILYAPDKRRHAAMAKGLGFSPQQVVDSLFSSVGNTGVAFTLMMLIEVLENAEAGERILLGNYGNGADILDLTVRQGVEVCRNRPGLRGIRKHLVSRSLIREYDSYAQSRGWLMGDNPRRPQRIEPSSSAIWRRRLEIIGLHGVKCRTCGYVQYPRQRVCTNCHTKDNFEDYLFSDKKAEIFTYTIDYLETDFGMPKVSTVIDFENGGRMVAEMAEFDLDKLQIGLPVEMSFRKLYTRAAIHNYFWKCVPLRD